MIAARDLDIIAAQLGRIPRSVVDVAARCACGSPVVVRTAPRLDDGTPFPTSYYLTHPAATKTISTLEAEGEMARLSQRLADDDAFATQYAAAHQDYLQRRAELGQVPEIDGVSAGGMPTRIKCLHALAAHSLAVGPGINPVGDLTLEMLADRGMWSISTCACDPTWETSPHS